MDSHYDPSRLLAALARELKIDTDRKLAKTLGFSAGIIAGLRAGRLSITATMYLQIQEKSGLPLQALQALSGDRRRRLRPSGTRAPESPRQRER